MKKLNEAKTHFQKTLRWSVSALLVLSVFQGCTCSRNRTNVTYREPANSPGSSPTGSPGTTETGTSPGLSNPIEVSARMAWLTGVDPVTATAYSTTQNRAVTIHDYTQSMVANFAQTGVVADGLSVTSYGSYMTLALTYVRAMVEAELKGGAPTALTSGMNLAGAYSAVTAAQKEGLIQSAAELFWGRAATAEELQILTAAMDEVGQKESSAKWAVVTGLTLMLGGSQASRGLVNNF